MQSTSHISPWIAAFSKNVDNPGTASEHSDASLDLPIGLGTDRAMEAWYYPPIA